MILVVRCKIFRAKLVSPPQMILGSYAHASIELSLQLIAYYVILQS